MKLFPFHGVALLPMLLGVMILSSPVSTALSTLKNDASSLATSALPASRATTASAVITSAGEDDTSACGAAASLEPVDVSAVPSSEDDVDALFAYVLERRAFDAALLITYDLRCDTSQAAAFPGPKGLPAYNPASMLHACKSWWTCNTAAEMVQRVKRAPRWGAWQKPQYDTCRERCVCAEVDAPTRHYAANFGCLNPQGGWVQGGVGLSSRENLNDAPVDIGGGFAMQAYHGPAREEDEEDEEDE